MLTVFAAKYCCIINTLQNTVHSVSSIAWLIYSECVMVFQQMERLYSPVRETALEEVTGAYNRFLVEC